MVIESLGGDLFGTIPLGDIVLYLNPLQLFLFLIAAFHRLRENAA